mgnify:CR=1 FL=1
MWQSLLLPDQLERPLMALGGVLGGLISFAFGDVGSLLWWLVIFSGVDWVTGNVGALRTGTWQSKVCGFGIAKKVLYFGVVALGHGLDQVFHPFLRIDIIQNIVICAYVAGEFGSIVENLGRCGLSSAVPPVIRRMILALNTNIEGAVDRVAGKEIQK